MAENDFKVYACGNWLTVGGGTVIIDATFSGLPETSAISVAANPSTVLIVDENGVITYEPSATFAGGGSHGSLTNLLVDDHTQYALRTELGEASGHSYGSTTNSIAEGDHTHTAAAHNTLTGLTTGDDHTQYSLLDGSKAYTGELSGTSAYFSSNVSSADMVFSGDASGTGTITCEGGFVASGANVGMTETITFTDFAEAVNIVTVVNGLIISWSQGG